MKITKSSILAALALAKIEMDSKYGRNGLGVNQPPDNGPRSDDECATCGIPRCTTVCPKKPLVRTAKTLLAALTIATVDAVADPGVASNLPAATTICIASQSDPGRSSEDCPATMMLAAAESPDQFIDRAKAYLTRNFNDPDSAKYRDLYIGADPDGPVLCGEVNARTGNGGMSGFRAFFSKPGDARTGSSKVARVPREFLTINNVDPDYLLQERERCVKPRPK